jgi:hypothetical protein
MAFFIGYNMKKLKKKMYFDETVQNAIVEYNKLDSQKESFKKLHLISDNYHPF